MSDPDKLQKLFEAALRAPVVETKALTRAFPHPHESVAPESVEIPAPVVLEASPAVSTEPISAEPIANVGLDEQSSKELGILLDDQMQRKVRRHRRELIGTLAVLVTILGGSTGWFIQSPARVTALGSAIREVRSVGDVAGMVAKYRGALDKIGAHAHDADLATESMGVSSSLKGEKDVNMDAEMHSMMIGEGKTTGERSAALTKSVGKMIQSPEPQAAAY